MVLPHEWCNSSLETPIIAKLNHHEVFLSASLPTIDVVYAPNTTAPKSFALNAEFYETIATMQGPVIFWRSDGVLEGFDEAIIKGYDNFSKLAAALVDVDSSEV